MKINNCYLDLWNGSRVMEYYVECFDRTMYIVINDKDFSDDDFNNMYKQLDENYCKWFDITTECCEEYMLDNLDEYYINSIMCVIYDEEDEDDE